MTDIFISYSKHDKDLVFSICNYLEKNGISCWIAPRNIPPGSEYAAEIIKGIENCKLFLLMYSDTSNESQHVLREVGRAVHRNAPIIAYRITKATPTKSMEYFLETIQWLDAPYKDCTSPAVLLKAIQNVINNQDIPVLPSTMPVHRSFSDLIRKYSAYIVGVLSVVIVCLLIIMLKFNNNNLGTNGNASDMLVEVSPTDDGGQSIDTSASPEPSEDISSQTSAVPNDASASPETPTEALTSSSPETNSSNSNNMVSEPDTPVVIVDHGNDDLPAHGSTVPDAPAPAVKEEKHSVKVGEYIEFGTYHPIGYSDSNNDGKIKWLILNVDESSGTALCLTEKIIDFKCYDGAESGSYGVDKEGNSYKKGSSYTPSQMSQFFGNSDWSSSNIRTWLNSGQAQVSYSDQPPVDNLTHAATGYASQSGFLYNFSSQEKSLICPRTNSTSGNALDGNTKTTTDKVFLLSQSEVQKYLVGQNLVVYTTPTQSAIASDRENIYDYSVSLGYKCYPWCLRTPDSSSSSDVLLVSTGTHFDGDFTKQAACYCCLGIRPAMVIKFGGSSLSGDGSEGNPYIIN